MIAVIAVAAWSDWKCGADLASVADFSVTYKSVFANGLLWCSSASFVIALPHRITHV